MSIVTGAWDRIRNVSGFETASGGTTATSAPLILPNSGVDTSGPLDITYYARFVLSNGSTVTVNGATLF